MSPSPDMVGVRVRIEPADHPHSEEVGVVVAQGPCSYCAESADGGTEVCGYDDLFVQLDHTGEIVRVYEPEAVLVAK